MFLADLGEVSQKTGNLRLKLQEFLQIFGEIKKHNINIWDKSLLSNIDIKSLQNKLLKVCCVPATSAGLPRVSFFFSFLFCCSRHLQY
jgi:hypothetical protein